MQNLIKLLVVGVIGYGAYLAIQQAQQQARIEQARTRVEDILSALAEGDEQFALCQWAKGKPILPAQEISALTDDFFEWRRRLGHPEPGKWTIDEVAPAGRAVRVAVDVAGRPKDLFVEAAVPIRFEP